MTEPDNATDVLRSVAYELDALQAVDVLVVGDVMLDRYVGGDVRRISPEAPVPVLLAQDSRAVLGGAANVAANVAAIGGRATLVGRVGDDTDAQVVRDLLDERGISHRLVVSDGTPTTTKTRIVAGTQQLVRIDNEVLAGPSPAQSTAITEQVKTFAARSGPRAVVLTDYAKGLLEPSLLRRVIDLCATHDVPVVTDPKGDDFSRYAGSTVIKPNVGEARAACPITPDPTRSAEDEIAALVAACHRTSGARNVVLSCSESGVAIGGDDAPILQRIPTLARDVADVSGAGDTLVALIAMGLGAGLPLLRTVEIANAAAGFVCGKVGTATLTGTDLLGVLEDTMSKGRMPREAKILASAAEAQDVGAQYQRDGRRLVFANGCFDLLHAGHVRLLAHARSLGDALMVALNSDESVRRLKGPDRPLQGEQDRCEIMAALASVDFVVVFGEETPLELVRAVRPALLVKGDDYSLEDVVGAREVASWGGEVVLVPRLPGRSTTGIIASSG